MIKQTFLFPEYYVHKEAYCDECNIKLQDTGMQLMSNPPLQIMKCPKCGKEYNISTQDLQGHWRWRSM